MKRIGWDDDPASERKNAVNKTVGMCAVIALPAQRRGLVGLIQVSIIVGIWPNSRDTRAPKLELLGEWE